MKVKYSKLLKLQVIIHPFDEIPFYKISYHSIKYRKTQPNPTKKRRIDLSRPKDFYLRRAGPYCPTEKS
jgi:hypothetical protein